MSQCNEMLLIQLLERCLPFLTAAKTGADITDSMKKEAPFLQKDVSDIIQIVGRQRREYENAIAIMVESEALKKLGEL